MKVGYRWLIEQYKIKALPLKTHAEIRPVTRIEFIGDCLATPRSVAPKQSIIPQTLFALKYEGINLSILSQVLPEIPEQELRQAYINSPTSKYLRKLCFLWEEITGLEIKRNSKSIKANYVPLFDPEIYLTGDGVRNQRWRVLWNGIGNLQYCVIVRKTPQLKALISKNLLDQLEEFTNSLSPRLLNRTLAWAYMDETRSSYAIEKELPASDKASRFVTLLKQAHDSKVLDEDYLVMLQNAVVDNPYIQAASFRTEQNYLSNGLRGALGVSYVPPSPDLANELMQSIIQLANNPPSGVAPLVIASIISFAFVYVHPFMDGNGRLSRFLFHKVLCLHGDLNNGLILPVSVTMKKNELQYKEVLEYWSSAVKDFWDITWLDDEKYEFKFVGHKSVYQYWDATRCVEFMLLSVEQTLEQELKQEAEYLVNYDLIYSEINNKFDVVDADLSKLIIFCMDQKGKISTNRRKQYRYKAPVEVFDAIEQAWKRVCRSRP